MHTPGKVGSGRAYLRLVLLHEPETLVRLATVHRLQMSVSVKVIIKALSLVRTGRHKATVSTKAGMLKAGHL